MTSFQYNLRHIRKSKKLSQAKLGQLIGTSGDVVGRYERGDITPSIEVAVKMADALEVSIDYLIGKSNFLYDQAMVQRIESIASLTKENRAFVFQLIDMVLRDRKAQEVYTHLAHAYMRGFENSIENNKK